MDATAGTGRWVVVSGPPGSGKSTLARQLADQLRLPLIAKDRIKEALMDCLPVNDVETSRQLGRPSVAALYAVAADCRSAVLDSVWHRDRAVAELRALGGRLVEVHCACARELAIERYRARTGSRPAGHFDESRTDAELWNPETEQPVAGGWPVLTIRTDRCVDLASLVEQVLQSLDEIS